MKQIHFGSTSNNPLVQALALIGGVLLLTAALFIGAFVFVTLLGLGLIAAGVFAVRLWWFRRKLRRNAAKGGNRTHRTRQQHHRDSVIEGEVIERQDHHHSSDKHRRR